MASLVAAAVTASTITSVPLPSRNFCALKWGQPAFVRRSHGSLALTNGCSAFVRSRTNRFHPVCYSTDMSPELNSTLDKVVRSHKVILFMKGTKDFPQCGFSHTVVQILKTLNAPFESVNILENEMLRQGLKEYSSWPTFPQLYIGGEFFGGCDITVEAYQSGELQELLEKTVST